MNREHFYLERERDVRLSCYRWMPDNPAAHNTVIQLAHGMAEHILRYETFISFLTGQGYIVYGHDHRGHGDSVVAPDDWGFFADSNGFEKAVNDIYAISRIIHTHHPHAPLVLFGHSMGSFLVRRYIQLYGERVSGVVLSGTSGHQGIVGKIGQWIAAFEACRIGRRTPSPLMDKLIFGRFNKQFQPARTSFDFLTRDEVIVDKYLADDKCGFICTAQFYADLLDGINRIHREHEIAKIPTELPIYLLAGQLDPVGDNSKGVQKVYEEYKRIGIKNVELTIYKNARHELLNEINNENVYTDITTWIQTFM